MKIIVGLGNPGEKYINTRHNIGFLAIDELKNQIFKSQFSIFNKFSNPNFQLQKKFNAEVLDFRPYNLDLMLIKPQTFMNSSGEAVKKIIQYNNITINQYSNIYIIHDDLDILLGEYKIQFGRSSAGHHGAESIINHLGTKDFWRVRIGIDNSGKPAFGSGYSTRLIPSKSAGRQPCSKPEPSAGKDYVLESFNKEEQKIIDEVINKVVGDLNHALSQP